MAETLRVVCCWLTTPFRKLQPNFQSVAVFAVISAVSELSDHTLHISANKCYHEVLSFREEFCEIFRAKDKTTMKMYTCKKFLKKDGRKVRKAAKNEILILKM